VILFINENIAMFVTHRTVHIWAIFDGMG